MPRRRTWSRRSANITKPKPRDRPVILSIITTASTGLNSAKAALGRRGATGQSGLGGGGAADAVMAAQQWRRCHRGRRVLPSAARTQSQRIVALAERTRATGGKELQLRRSPLQRSPHSPNAPILPDHSPSRSLASSRCQEMPPTKHLCCAGAGAAPPSRRSPPASFIGASRTSRSPRSSLMAPTGLVVAAAGALAGWAA